MNGPSKGKVKENGKAPESPPSPRASPLKMMVALTEKTRVIDGLGLGDGARREGFQRLVRRFILQIRYGCTNQYCTTPTCFTCHKRVHRYPVQRPSVLAARSIAFQLATEDDPFSALCPHTPLATPDDFVQFGTRGLEPAHVCKSTLDTKEQARDEPEIRQKTRHASEITALDPLEEAAPTHPEQAAVSDQLPSDRGLGIPGPIFDYQEIHRNGAYKKDKKSLTQRLFDTNSVKAFEWKTIISPMDILKTPSVNGGVAKDHEVNGHVTAHQNHDEVESGEQRRDQVIEIQQEGSVEPTFSSETSPANGHVISPTDAPQTSEATSTQDHSDTRELKVPAAQVTAQVTVVEDLTGYLLSGLRSLAAHAKVQSGVSSTGSYNDSSTAVDHAARPKVIELVKRTLIYHFADPIRLSRFVQHNKALAAASAFPPHLVEYFAEDGHVGMTVNSFTNWVPLVGPLLLDSLWQSLGALFVPPPDIVTKCGHPSSRSEKAGYLPDAEASGMIYVAILALVGSGYILNDKSQHMVSDLRAWGRTLANSHQWGKPDPLAEPWLDIADYMEYEPAVRLARRIAHVVAARRSFWLISQTMCGKSSDGRIPLMSSIITLLKNQLLLDRLTKKVSGPRSSGVPFYLLEWMRTVILKTWDGEVIVKRWEGTGAALDFIADLYHARHELGLPEAKFVTPFISNHLTDAKVPEYMALPRSDKNILNILDFSFLFMPQIRVSYFRAINFASMSEAYSSAVFTDHLKDKMLRHAGGEDFGRNVGRWDRTAFLDTNMKAALTKYLVLDVRRQHILEDALNQVWGLEKRELLRPLKVRMGMGEGGEEGVDHGGVSQEFFRLVFEKAFTPEAGLFVTTDPQANMTWFQPLTLEPLQTYELLGLLVGLAVYNGITVPMTFPQALYRKLLGLRDEHRIDDGWPTLLKSLQEMENWKEGDVSDVFVREFAFSCTANGENWTADMRSQLKSSDDNTTQTKELARSAFVLAKDAPDLPLVTNQTRTAYRKEYIRWLVDVSIQPQFDAFAKGFETVLSKRSLSLLSPALFKNLVEGHQAFDVRGLYKAVRYEDGYSRDSTVIQWFWKIVFEWEEEGKTSAGGRGGDGGRAGNGSGEDKKKRLLEFVTASQRVPVQGWSGLAFSIVRNGGDTERIPTSMTCFGKLLLPEYSCFDKLKGKLEIALENSQGFGSA
ncbi:Lysophospholipase 1 [Venturia nashicola]|uniref:HECT-type E3 ubiquitin transferase n=1 Tax=Venturia nashicola TaxID=86259 RepID=A0A4Z1PD35_9PEZI|nr:Lysophospholipase 1 [Venturia nashicola]